MDELMRIGWGSVLIWSPLLTVLALLVIGLVYFLAPALGYTSTRRGLVLAALWFLVARLGLGLFNFALLLEAGFGGTTPWGAASGTFRSLGLLFALLEYGLLVLSMALFVVGLASLRRKEDLFRPPGLPQIRDRD